MAQTGLVAHAFDAKVELQFSASAQMGVTSPKGNLRTLGIFDFPWVALDDLATEAPKIVPIEVDVLPAQSG